MFGHIVRTCNKSDSEVNPRQTLLGTEVVPQSNCGRWQKRLTTSALTKTYFDKTGQKHEQLMSPYEQENICKRGQI